MAITTSPPAENTDPWFTARNAFDTEVKSTANAAETAAAAAGTAAATADGKAVAAQATANAAVPTAAVAGLNTVGWARAVFIAKGGTIPGGTPVYTLVVEAAT